MEDANYLMKHSSEIRRPPEAKLKECSTLNPAPAPRHISDSYQQSCSWNIAIKHLTKFPWVGIHSFKGKGSLLCPHLPGKATKLFFSTSSRTVSESPFSTRILRPWFQHQLPSSLRTHHQPSPPGQFSLFGICLVDVFCLLSLCEHFESSWPARLCLLLCSLCGS